MRTQRGFCFWHGEENLQQTHTHTQKSAGSVCVQMDAAGNHPCISRRFYASEMQDAQVDGLLRLLLLWVKWNADDKLLKAHCLPPGMYSKHPCPWWVLPQANKNLNSTKQSMKAENKNINDHLFATPILVIAKVSAAQISNHTKTDH